LGWDFDKNATVASFHPGDEIQISEDKTLYAIWETTATLVFNPNGGTGADKRYSQKSLGDEISISFEFTRTNYSFIGWATSPTATVTEYSADVKQFTIESNQLGKTTTLYAVWVGKAVTLGFINRTSVTDTLDSIYPIVRYGEQVEIPDASYFDLEGGDYRFLGWSTSEYSLGDEIPEIAYEGGENINVDALAVYEELGYITLYAVIVESNYTYSTTIVDATFEMDGYIDYTCEENPSKNYRQIISKNSLFYAYVYDVYNITNKGTVIVTTIEQGSINEGDRISIVLKDGTIQDDVIIEGIELNSTTVQTAQAGDEVGLLVNIDKNSIQRGCLICEKGKALHTNTIYVKAQCFSKEDGGRTLPFFLNYRPQIVIGGKHPTYYKPCIQKKL